MIPFFAIAFAIQGMVRAFHTTNNKPAPVYHKLGE